MKNIIVPTDFSANANDALQYAIHLANRFESKIHLIHVYEVRRSTGSLVSMRDIIHNDALDQLNKLVHENKNRLLRSASIETKAIEGYPSTTINSYANSFNAEMIIMGTQGASGLKEIFLGSNTSSVINKSKTSVLVIPVNAKYQPIKDIAFAVDDQILSTEDVARPLTEIAKEYNAKIKVIHVEKEQQVTSVDAGIDIYLTDVEHSFQIINDKNINDGINKFITENNPDLLCMVHRKRGRLGNIFHQSVTNKEAFNSPIPLLVLNDEY